MPAILPFTARKDRVGSQGLPYGSIIAVPLTFIEMIATINLELGLDVGALDRDHLLKPGFIMEIASKVRAVIFDLGGVLCASAVSTPPLPPKLTDELCGSLALYECNCGRLQQDEYFRRLAEICGVSISDIANAFALARIPQAQNDIAVSGIRELRLKHPGLQVYAMSNISKPEWEILRCRPLDWGLFDSIFTSWEAGMAKPELCFYRLVLEAARIAPGEAILVDHKLENIIAAQSMGFYKTILSTGTVDLRRELLNALCDPVQRGTEWLLNNSKSLWSESEIGTVIQDSFSQLLIFEAIDGTCALVRTLPWLASRFSPCAKPCSFIHSKADWVITPRDIIDLKNPDRSLNYFIGDYKLFVVFS